MVQGSRVRIQEVLGCRFRGSGVGSEGSGVLGSGVRGEDLLEELLQLLVAAAGPVEAVEGSLYQRSHDAAQRDLVSTVITLAVMLHTQPANTPQSALLRVCVNSCM